MGKDKKIKKMFLILSLSTFLMACDKDGESATPNGFWTTHGDKEGRFSISAFNNESIEELHLEVKSKNNPEEIAVIVLPVNYSDAYKNAVIYEKEHELKIGNSIVKLQRIAFGKFGTTIDYTSQYGKVSIEEMIVDGVVYELASAFGTGKPNAVTEWNVSLGAVEPPKNIEIVFEKAKSHERESLVINLSN